MNNQNIFKMQNTGKYKITAKFDFLNYLKFLLLNIPIVLLPIIGFFLISKGTLLDILGITAVALAIIFFQYPILVLAKPWLLKIAVFYLSMVIFLFLYGVLVTWDFSAGGYEAGSLGARLHGGVVTTIFGHLFGGIFFPFIVLINWLLRKFLFVYIEE